MSNGNITIKEAPDFYTSALQAYQEESDKIERRDIRESDRMERDDAKAEDRRRYEEKKEEEKEIRNRDEWQLMYDGAKDFNQKAMVYQAGLNAGVSGLTPEMHDSIKTRAMEEEQGKELLNKYYSSNDADKINMYPEVRSHLIKSGNPNDRVLLNSLEQDNKTRKATQGNQQVAELIVSQYPDVFTPATKSFIEGASTLSPESVKMFGTMVSSHIESTTKNYTAGMKAAMELINREEPGIDATDEDRLRHRALIQMGLSMKAELEGKGRPEDEETKKQPYPDLGQYDSEKQGKDFLTGSFDNLSQEEKSKQFSNAMDELGITKESWADLEDSERKLRGREVIDYINKKDYSRVIEPVKAAGFAGVQYEDPKGTIEITDEMIDAKLPEAMESLRIPKGQQKNPKVLSQAREKAEEMVRKELQKQSRQRATRIAKETLPPLRTGPFGFVS